MSNLIINHSLFYDWNGKKRATWGLPIGDGCDSDSEFNCYIDHIRRYNCHPPGIIICLNNESYISLFDGGYMNMATLNKRKCDRLVEKCAYLKSIGFLIVFALFDGPSDPRGKYYPILNQMDKHEDFMALAADKLDPYADAFLIGCETNRYAGTEAVEAGIATMKKYTWKPVSTHEQLGVYRDGNGAWKANRRYPANGDFVCYETNNHPKDGDNISVADMVTEIQGLHSALPPGHMRDNIWVAEHNWSFSNRSREQAGAMSGLPYVRGMGGPL